MKKILLYWLLVLGVALLFAGCTNEEDAADMASSDLTVNIKVDDPVSVGSSRAFTDADENKIANIHIVAFDYDTGEMISNGYTTADNLSSMTCKLAINAEQNTKVVMYAIANIGSPKLFDSHELTQTDFENLYIKIAAADKMTAGTYNLCKSDGTVLASINGETHAMLISDKITRYQHTITSSSFNVTLNLSRPTPKLVLNLYGSNVTLAGYQFCNVPTSDAFLVDETDMTGVIYSNTYKEPFAGNTTTAEGITFYGMKSYKAPNTNVTTQRQRIEANAPENAAYLEIVGSPESNRALVYTYRVYLGGVDATGAMDPSEFSLLRNHDYHLNIILSDNTAGDNRIDLYKAIVLTPIIEEWTDGGTIQFHAQNGDTQPKDTVMIGDFVFSDGTWGSLADNSGKTPVAIIFSNTPSIFDFNAGYTHGYAMALKDVGSYKWAGDYTDTGIPPTSDYWGWQDCSSEMDGRRNTSFINSTDFPAGYAAATTFNSQVAAPSGTSGWFLPSCGQWYTIFVNLGGISATPRKYTSLMWEGDGLANLCVTSLNNKLSAAGNGNYGAFDYDVSYWSSSVRTTEPYSAYISRADYVIFASAVEPRYEYRVRPVLAF